MTNRIMIDDRMVKAGKVKPGNAGLTAGMES